MEYRRLGSTGLVVSRLCLGMMSYGSPDWQRWVLGRGEGLRFVRLALDAGVNFFDTADFYSLGASEEILGEAIATLTDRRSVVLATKVGLPMRQGPNGGGASRKHIMAAIDESLRRLRTDYVDLYQMHKWDDGVPLEETVEALNDVVRAGKALHTGVTNYSTWQFAKGVYMARGRGWTPFSTMQLQYNLAYREEEREMIPFCRSEGIGIVVFSPLARGWLAGIRSGGKVSDREAVRGQQDAKGHQLYGSPSDREVLQALLALAEKRKVPPSRLALAWLYGHDFVDAAITGPLEDYHLTEALAALDLRLDPDEIAALEAPYAPQAVKDDAFNAVSASIKW